MPHWICLLKEQATHTFLASLPREASWRTCVRAGLCLPHSGTRRRPQHHFLLMRKGADYSSVTRWLGCPKARDGAHSPGVYVLYLLTAALPKDLIAAEQLGRGEWEELSTFSA